MYMAPFTQKATHRTAPELRRNFPPPRPPRWSSHAAQRWPSARRRSAPAPAWRHQNFQPC